MAQHTMDLRVLGLLLVALPLLAVQFFTATEAPAGLTPYWPVSPTARFLGGITVALIVTAVWAAVDVGLIAWIRSRFRSGGDAAKGTEAFFLWQVLKVSYAIFILLLLLACVFSELSS